MSTLRVWLAFAAPFVVLGIGSLAARHRLPADPLARTMLGGCVRLSGGISATLRGIGRGLAHAGRFALAGWVALVVVAVLGWFVVAVVVSTVTVFDRAIIAGWVALVALAGLRTARTETETDPFFTMALHLAAVRAALPTKAGAKVGTDRNGTAILAGQHWGLSNFKASTNEHGDRTATYYLPAGVVASDVIKARDLFLARLAKGIPSDRFVVDMDHEVNRLRVTVLAPLPDLSPRTPDLSSPTDCWQPFVIGRDMRGRDLTMPTWNVGQSMIAGMIGSGKSVASRVPIAHFARAGAILRIYDGKGDYDDLDGPLRHRCERFLRLGEPDLGRKYMAELDDLLAEVQRRNNARGREHHPMLVVLEEAPQLRSAVPKGNERARHDEVLKTIVNTCRSSNVFVLVLAQRPASSQWPTDVRAQTGTALCMRVERPMDAVVALGTYPEDDKTILTLPDGQGLLKVKGAPERVIVDYIDDATWRAFCASLPSVWPAEDDAPEGTEDAPGPQDAPAAEVEDVRPSLPPGRAWVRMDGTISHAPALLVLVGQVLDSQGQTAITSGQLVERLPLGAIDHGTMRPEDLPTTATQLGIVLRGYGIDTSKRTVPAAKGQARWVTREDVLQAIRQHRDTSRQGASR